MVAAEPALTAERYALTHAAFEAASDQRPRLQAWLARGHLLAHLAALTRPGAPRDGAAPLEISVVRAP